MAGVFLTRTSDADFQPVAQCGRENHYPAQLPAGALLHCAPIFTRIVLPEVTRKTFSPELSALIALSIIASAYLAEVIRGGLASLNSLQVESGYATGLSKAGIFIWIVLPQAIRNMLPALLATWIMLFKTTTLIYVIGIVEFFHAATIVNARELIPYTVYSLLAIVYFVCCYAISALVRRLDPKYILQTS